MDINYIFTRCYCKDGYKTIYLLDAIMRMDGYKNIYLLDAIVRMDILDTTVRRTGMNVGTNLVLTEVKYLVLSNRTFLLKYKRNPALPV